MASVSAAESALRRLFLDMAIQLQFGETLDQTEAYAVGGERSTDPEDLNDYVNLLLAFRRLPIIRLVDARFPINESGEYVNALIDADSVFYESRVEASGSDESESEQESEEEEEEEEIKSTLGGSRNDESS
jgi:hypothetical protein